MTQNERQSGNAPFEYDRQARERLTEHFYASIPYNRALGMELLSLADNAVHTRLAYRPVFLGDAAAGLWHTSVATALADATCGLTTLSILPEGEVVATLDLRMDYLRPAVADRDLHAKAECHHLTRSVAFTRATLYQEDLERPTALCTAAFMRTSKGSA